MYSSVVFCEDFFKLVKICLAAATMKYGTGLLNAKNYCRKVRVNDEYITEEHVTSCHVMSLREGDVIVKKQSTEAAHFRIKSRYIFNLLSNMLAQNAL